MSVELERGGPVFPPAPDIGQRSAPLRSVATSLAAGDSAPHKLNSAFGVLLVIVVALAPIPLGSNRPAFWTLWAIAIGLLAIVYALALLWLRAPARQAIASLWPEAASMVVVMGWLCLQMLPIGRWLPDALSAIPLVGGNATTISLDPGSTRLTLLNFATYALLFLLFAQVSADRRRARGMLLSLFLVISGFAVYGLVSLVQFGDTLLGFEKLYYLGSATGTFINRNSFATFLASGLAMGVPLLLDSFGRSQGGRPARSWIRQVLVLMGLLFIAATLLATNSRMGAIAGFAGAIVGFALSIRRVESSRARLWFGLAAVAAIGLVAFVYGAGTLQRLIFTDEDAGRGELYRQVWGTILQRPWTGYGGGSFATVFPLFQHPPLAGDTIWDKAHSTYLALWFEMGLVVGTLPLMVVFALFLRSTRGLWDASSRMNSAATIGVTVVFAIHSLVDFSAEIMANAFLFTAVLALGAARTGKSRAGER